MRQTELRRWALRLAKRSNTASPAETRGLSRCTVKFVGRRLFTPVLLQKLQQNPYDVIPRPEGTIFSFITKIPSHRGDFFYSRRKPPKTLHHRSAFLTEAMMYNISTGERWGTSFPLPGDQSPDPILLGKTYGALTFCHSLKRFGGFGNLSSKGSQEKNKKEEKDVFQED